MPSGVAQDFGEELRCGIDDLRLLDETVCARDESGDFEYAGDVLKPEFGLDRGKEVHGCDARRLASLFDGEFSEPARILHRAGYERCLAGEEPELASTGGLHVLMARGG